MLRPHAFPAPRLAVLIILLLTFSTSPADELDDALAATARLDPGWTTQAILAKRQQARMPDAQNSVVQAEKALKLLPQGWLSSGQGGVDNAPLRPGEVPRGARLYNLLFEVPANQSVPEGLAAGLRAELDAIAPAVQEARQLVSLPDGQTSYQPAEMPLATLLPYTQNTRQVARLLQMDAVRRALDGDLNGGLASTHAMLNLARSIGDEPTLISQLVRIAIDQLAIQTLERVLATGPPASISLETIQPEFAREALAPRLAMALAGERAMFHDTFAVLSRDPSRLQEIVALTGDPSVSADAIAKVLPPPSQRAAFFRHNEAVGLQFWNRAVGIGARPLAEQAPLWQQWDADLKALRPSGANPADTPFLAMLLMSGNEAVFHAEMRIVCRLRAAELALACERFRQKNNRWPGRKEDLVPTFIPEWPVDPYSGKLLRVSKSTDGLVLYGLGDDSKDDRGNLSPKGLTSQGFDVGLHLYDPAHRARPAR